MDHRFLLNIEVFCYERKGEIIHGSHRESDQLLLGREIMTLYQIDWFVVMMSRPVCHFGRNEFGGGGPTPSLSRSPSCSRVPPR